MQNKLGIYIIGGLIILLFFALFSLTMGVYKFEDESFTALLKAGILDLDSIDSGDWYVFSEIRLPRVIMAILIGSALAVSGAAMQGMFKNPLATPSLIGVTSGASLFAAIAIVLGSFIRQFTPEIFHEIIISLMAFIGAILTMTFVYRMSTNQRKTNVVIMLLAGVAISAMAGAITGFLIYLTDEEELRNLTFWTLGSLGGATWIKNAILTVVIGFSYFFLINKGKALNAMMLGEQDAAHLGIPVEKVKKQIVILTALMVGTCVAFAGTIGFVGLIIPYILRLIFRSNYHLILPLSAIAGGILLLCADTFSRTIVAPSEMPIGVVTAFIGAPVFIAILIRYKKSL
ncbi:MAG: iron ABC transporter permease [Weeksellaceae bacterium]|jgi:iron complex transport system permease protein|nr:iron ABC transporter permease [Weeksellaceae bacterium]MDX9704313.1 iron ABC transporter permease [Weeksellaceae bacterium]